MRYILFLSLAVLGLVSAKAEVPFEKNRDNGFEEKNVEAFFEKLEQKYQEAINSYGEHYIAYRYMQTMFQDSLFQNKVKEVFTNILEKRDDFFNEIKKICQEYPEDSLSVSLEKEINESLTFIDGKTSTALAFHLFSDKKFQKLLIETLIKDDLIDEMYEDFDECLKYSDLLYDQMERQVGDIAREYLLSHTEMKKEDLEQKNNIIDNILEISSLEKLLEKDSYNSEFEKKIAGIYENYTDKKNEFLDELF